MRSPHVSLIVTTYQMPGHLRLALASIAGQRTERQLEVVVSDDGSQDETEGVVAQFARQVPFPVRFVTRKHAGHCPARSRNAGARHAKADHLLFCDGDCLLPPDHVEAHLRAYRPGSFTSGYCARLDEAASRKVIAGLADGCNLAKLAPASELRKLAAMHRKAWWYSAIAHPTKPALKSTDFSLARMDFERVNGFDEQFEGWGCEDDDLGRRLIAAGVRPISVLDRTRLYHLWHPPAASKPAKWRYGPNVAYFQRPIRLTRCLDGLVRRLPRELTVRLAGEPYDSPALSQVLDFQGWQIACDPESRADIELLAWPGRGQFCQQGDCCVLAVLDERSWLPWRARQAHVVLSPSGTLGRPGQVRLRLADAAGFWQALLGPPTSRLASARPSSQRTIETPAYDHPVQHAA